MALEITVAEKGCGGSLLYIQKLFGKSFVAACQIIPVFVEKCGEKFSGELVKSAKEEKAVAKMGVKNKSAFVKLIFIFQTKIVCSRAGPMDAMNNLAFVSSAIAFRYARAFGGRSANLRALSVGVRQPSNST